MDHRSSSSNSMQDQLGFPFLSVRWVDISQRVWPVRWVQVSGFPSSKGRRKEHIDTAVSAPIFCLNSLLSLTPRKPRVPCYFFFCFIFLHFKTGIVNVCSTGLQKTLKQCNALTSHIQNALTLYTACKEKSGLLNLQIYYLAGSQPFILNPNKM